MQANKFAERVDSKVMPAPIATVTERRDIVILILLLAAHAACFLPICFKVGFYLDDWLTFWNLHFAPHNFVDLLKASFSDPRMVTRPVQCLYYATTYFFFGDKPLYYHLLRFSLEYAGAVFLYLGLKRLSTSHFLAALSALLFLLYPTHDATHYWIGAALGPGFGLTLYLASFYFTLCAFETRKTYQYVLAVALYGLSAFCYESYLTMLVLSICGILLLSSEYRTESRLNTFASTLRWFAPFIIVGLLEPVYQRLLLPKLTHVFLSPSTVDPIYFFNVFVQGLNVSFFAGLWSFMASRIRECVLSLTAMNVWQLVGTLAATAAIMAVSYSRNQRVEYKRLSIACGLTILASYLTFAVAQGYTPVLDTMINRVNIGSSVAVSILLAMTVKWLVERFHRADPGYKLSCRPDRRAITISAMVLPLVACMVMANLGMSAFWICSWDVQKNVRFLISKNAENIKDGDAIILGNTHRYLMWAPVFDGTWDFQSMLRMTLNKNTVSGGVISDRLCISGNKIQDISLGYICASYDADKVQLLIPSEPAWIPVKTSQNFIDLVKQKTNRDISAETLKRWREGADKSIFSAVTH